MKPSALRLPIRTLPRQPSTQWICRRCLATESVSSPSTTTPPPIARPKVRDASEAEKYDPTLPASQRDYRLTKTDFHLKKALPHKIPAQYLQHSTSDILHQAEQAQRDKVTVHKKIIGVVVRTGKMDKTVTVRVPRQTWNRRIKKYFTDYTRHKVHDPNNSLIEGDVIEMHRLRASADVHHVVASIISPFGKPVADRPPIPTADERLAMYKEKRFAKLHRRTLRRKATKGSAGAIDQLLAMGLDPGTNVMAGKGETVGLEAGAGKLRTPRKGAILGAKGQKLPEGVLPGGKHEVGKINERAQRNKGKAMKFQEQAEANLLEAKEKGADLEKQGLVNDTGASVQGEYERRQ